ncbi:MAG: hypothetical protein GF350_14120 [Chitinivibrionales bacterium]|nr:hypothetical protein [Chitinivibrionales bacterium]
MNTATRILLVYSSISVFAAILSAGDSSLCVIPLDGANEIYYPHEFPVNTTGSYSILSADVFDKRSLRSLFDSTLSENSLFARCDTSPLISFWTRVGSEMGDNLLNATGPQRDHFDNFGIHCNIPGVPLYALARYRYSDHYSDRFNTLWGEYASHNGRWMDYYDEGLLKDITGAYLYNKDILTVEGSLKRYGVWGAAPYFFTPLYRKGYATAHDASYDFGFARTAIGIDADFQNWYYDHHTPEEKIDTRIDAAWVQPFAGTYRGSVRFHSEPLATPSHALSVSVEDTTGDPLFWKAGAGIFGNGQPEAELGCGLNLRHRFMVDATAQWAYYPRDENYVFAAIRDTVHYRCAGYGALSLHGSVDYRDTLVYPVTCRTWYNFTDTQLWEIIDTSSGTPSTIYQEPHDDNISTAGGEMLYEITLPFVMLTFRAGGHYRIDGGKQRIKLPWNCGIDFCLGTRDPESILANITLNAVGPATIRYKHVPDYSLQSFTAPAHSDLYFMLRIPFVSPVLRDHIKAAALVETGPVHLDVSKRIKKHPLGNPVGPVISVRLDVSFL